MTKETTIRIITETQVQNLLLGMMQNADDHKDFFVLQWMSVDGVKNWTEEQIQYFSSKFNNEIDVYDYVSDLQCSLLGLMSLSNSDES